MLVQPVPTVEKFSAHITREFASATQFENGNAITRNGPDGPIRKENPLTEASNGDGKTSWWSTPGRKCSTYAQPQLRSP